MAGNDETHGRTEDISVPKNTTETDATRDRETQGRMCLCGRRDVFVLLCRVSSHCMMQGRMMTFLHFAETLSLNVLVCGKIYILLNVKYVYCMLFTALLSKLCTMF